MIMEFIKSQRVAFYASIVAVILALVSIIIYGVNTTNNYYVTSGSANISALVIVFTVIAMILLIARIVIAEKFDGAGLIKHVTSILTLVACVFIASAFFAYVGERVYDIAIVLASDLEAGNVAATDAVMQTIAGFVLYAVTLIFAIVSAFARVRKDSVA